MLFVLDLVLFIPIKAVVVTAIVSGVTAVVVVDVAVVAIAVVARPAHCHVCRLRSSAQFL